jgi:hypothetical protein
VQTLQVRLSHCQHRRLALKRANREQARDAPSACAELDDIGNVERHEPADRLEQPTRDVSGDDR